MKIGVIDVGGGLRGIYATGVFDYFSDNNIEMDLCIGVSAGSANVASYVAKQKERNYPFYTEYSFRKEYMSIKNFISKGSYIDLNYVYGTLSNAEGESPLNYPMIMKNPTEMLVVATNAITGKAVYFDKNDLKQNCYDIFKASSAIPFVCKPYIIDDIPYFDGALSDPVPIKKAFQYGCDKVILILTKPVDFIRHSKKDKMIANRIRKSYPNAADSLKKEQKHIIIVLHWQKNMNKKEKY
ncbi:MAG: patatin family protein [Faecalibacillus sp.]